MKRSLLISWSRANDLSRCQAMWTLGENIETIQGVIDSDLSIDSERSLLELVLDRAVFRGCERKNREIERWRVNNKLSRRVLCGSSYAFICEKWIRVNVVRVHAAVFVSVQVVDALSITNVFGFSLLPAYIQAWFLSMAVFAPNVGRCIIDGRCYRSSIIFFPQ